MEFMRSRPDVVRSRDQCWLLGYWNELRGTAPLPTWADLQPEALGVPSDDLSITEVVTVDGAERFQIKFHGVRIAELYGRVNCVGKFLDEILPANARQGALATYLHVVATGCPVYTVSDLRDRAGRIVHYERLLLPFSNSGLRVDRVLASLETVSPEGAFDNQGLMMSPPKAPAFALCTTVHF